MPQPPLTPFEHEIARRLGAYAVADDPRALEAALDAYRRSRTGRRRERWTRLRRAGVACTAAAAVTMSGGIVAAYAATLPSPVQRVAHALLAPLGVPAPHHLHAATTASHRMRPAVSTSPSPPTGAKTTRRPASTLLSLTMTATRDIVSAGSSGVLTVHIQPAPRDGHRTWQVRVTRRVYGKAAPATFAIVHGRGDRTIQLRTRPLDVNTTFVAELVSHRRALVASEPLTIAVRPELSIHVAPRGLSTILTIQAHHAAVGDRVFVLHTVGTRTERLSAPIDRRGHVSFTTSSGGRWVVLLAATPRHAAARAVVGVPNRPDTPSTTPTPTKSPAPDSARATPSATPTPSPTPRR
jgi:hypothetical protein